MSLIDSDTAEKVLSRLIVGAQLDSIRVYSLIMQMCFFVPAPIGQFPNELWVSFSGLGTLHDIEAAFEEQHGDERQDFFRARAKLLADVYFLLGKQVNGVSIGKSGILRLEIGGKCLLVAPDEDSNLEEIWSVRNCAHEPITEKDWYIALDDSGVLAARMPSVFLSE